MNIFDQSIIGVFNQFAQLSWTVDTLIMTISDSDLLKGYLSLPLLWWAWFRGPRQEEDRRTVLLTIFGALSAVAVARLLQLTLPFRSRPIHTADLPFTIPHSMPADFLDGWSSFPSDHASLFFALATGLWLISPLIGLFGFLHAALLVSLPRIYVGLHFPTDILSGAWLGVTAVIIIWKCRGLGRPMLDGILKWSHSSPHLFYPALFFLTSELAHLFKDSRWLAESLWNLVKAAAAH
ncbi:MAG: phosphatase PAP2 family protein [Nitrospira sp. CR1.2]|nr:phosphatase PAP2 family protein [Nitrospira sp. CR1.2]